MNKNDPIALAKAAIYGSMPKTPESIIGYKMAQSYFDPCIEMAELVYLDQIPPRYDFEIMLKNAFEYADYQGFLKMPTDTQHAIQAISNRFFNRYRALVGQREMVAA